MRPEAPSRWPKPTVPHPTLICPPPLPLRPPAGHKVYGIEATALVPLVSSASHRAFVRGDRDTAAAEQRYRKLLCGVALNQVRALFCCAAAHQNLACVVN